MRGPTKSGPDQFSQFDIYRLQTNRQSICFEVHKFLLFFIKILCAKINHKILTSIVSATIFSRIMRVHNQKYSFLVGAGFSRGTLINPKISQIYKMDFKLLKVLQTLLKTRALIIKNKNKEASLNRNEEIFFR